LQLDQIPRVCGNLGGGPMFQDVLREVVDGTEGGVAGLLMGYDGIPVDQYVRDEGIELPIDTVGQEYSVILKEIRKAAEMLEAGEAREMAVKAERMITVVRLLNDEYFVAVTLKPEGNLGKARFLLRTRTGKLLDELT
ncbi:MAG: roadblock/LC7 domain-containing protein, partial [Myxococcota bacterium]